MRPEVIKPILLQRLTPDGTSRDYDSILSDMMRLIPTICPNWTDLSQDDPGVVILQLLAFGLDNLHYILDWYMQQRVIRTVNDRQACADLMQLLCYKIPSAEPAVVTLRFSIASFPVSGSNIIDVPTKTSCETSFEVDDEVVKFETDDDTAFVRRYLITDTDGTEFISVGAGNTGDFQVGMQVEIKDESTPRILATVAGLNATTGIIELANPITSAFKVSLSAYVAMLECEVDATEGETKTETLGTSDGKAFQKFSTTYENVIDGSLVISVLYGTEVQYTEVYSLIDSDETDLVYTSYKSSYDKVTIRFGDGITGFIPQTGASILATYRVGGGQRGRVGAETITSLTSVITHDGIPINVTVTNDEAASGGEDAQSVSVTREIGAASALTLDRAVTLLDFEYLSREVSGVSRAQGVKLGLGFLKLYILGSGGALTTSTVKQNVLEYLDTRRLIGDGLVTVYDPTFIYLDISATITLEKTSDSDSVSDYHDSLIDDFFNPSENAKLVFGDGVSKGFIQVSSIYRLLNDVTIGVVCVVIDKFTILPTVTYKIWRDSGVTINTITISTEVVYELWTITMLNPTQFYVSGSVSGRQTIEGTIGAVYTSDNGHVSFIVSGGTLRAGDYATFRTSSYRSEVIQMQTGEIAANGRFTKTYQYEV